MVTVNSESLNNLIAGDIISRSVEGVDMKFDVMQSDDYVADDFYGNALVHGFDKTNIAISTETSGRIVIPEIVPDTEGCTIKWIYNPYGAYEVSPKLEGLKIVGIMQYAFYGCDKITSVDIPESVKSISFASFGGCTSLTEVTVLSPNPPVLRRSVFPSEIYHNATLRVPSGTKDAYANSDWSNYFQNIEELDEEMGGGKPKNGDKSDVNGDGKVDVADISSVISVMASSSTDAQADVNGDGKVDVADISAIISKMAE